MGRRQRLFVAILGFGLLFVASVPAAAINKREIVTQARAAYYNLKAQGLKDFRCTAAPNWAKMLEGRRQRDQAKYDEALNTLKQLSFVVTVNASGKTEVTHNTPAAGNAQLESGFQDIFKGMEQLMSGFFDTCSPFAFMGLSPAPEANNRLNDLGSQYRLA